MHVSPGSRVEDKTLEQRTSAVSEEYLRYLDNPQNVEKRFPVDRRKLEELIKGVCVRVCVSLFVLFVVHVVV